MCGMCVQDLEAVCREAAKQAADWAASVRSTSELADDTGYELCSGHSRSLVAVIAEKRDCARLVLLSSFPTPPLHQERPAHSSVHDNDKWWQHKGSLTPAPA